MVRVGRVDRAEVPQLVIGTAEGLAWGELRAEDTKLTTQCFLGDTDRLRPVNEVLDRHFSQTSLDLRDNRLVAPELERERFLRQSPALSLLSHPLPKPGIELTHGSGC